jgi:predicted metal-dependent phosphoesterase TrpH
MHAEKWIDLHTHSTFSDGNRRPAELVEIAVRKGLSALALADHDCLDGFGELKEAADSVGLEVITAVELSSEHNGRDLHILGYGIDPENEALRGALRAFVETREQRGVKIVQKLAGMGVELDMDVILAKSGGGALGRPHIAEALVEGGYVADFPEAFARYLGEDCPAYVPKYKISPRDAVAHIHAAAGLAFVAHPGYYLEDTEAFANLLQEGFDGIEVHHPYHKNGVVDRLLEVARERNLLISGGSDFHGFAGRDNMGEPKVPYSVLENIKRHMPA